MENKIAFNEQPNIVRRQALINHDFTIISSSCMGAIFYHELGLRFDSPTINLAIYPKDYLEFITHLHTYLESNDWEEDQNANEEWPVGILKRPGQSIRVHFVHYTDFATAVTAWNMRSKRVHYNNLYYVMAEENGTTLKDLTQFDQLPFKHKVAFTAHNYPELESAFWLKDCEIDGQLGMWYKADNYLGKLKIDNFDLVKFLNQK